MNNFWTVTLFHAQPSASEWELVQHLGTEEFSALGIEEFSLDEPAVDALLGDRSYSGGDLPQEVLDEVEARVLEKPTTFRFFFDDEANAQNFAEQISKIVLTEIGVEECPGEDWNAEWKKHYAPIKVNEKIEIIPSWLKPHPPSSEKQIYIYPGMGFGTGSHETTFLCLKLFTELVLVKNLETVLDFGSGSGILGLSTFQFYPDAKVDFYDIDSEANKNCDQNAALNGLQDKKFRLLLPEVRSYLLPRYDLVFANILESILLMEQKFLKSALNPGGSLILSGLLKHQMPAIISAYESRDLKLVKEEVKGDWGALLFQKADIE